MKIDKKKREEGSAIILAILLLSFFMALSMNMFFIAKKKSENAGVKAVGVNVLSNIDGGASIGYYELNIASRYVTEGLLKRDVAGVPSAAIIATLEVGPPAVTEPAQEGVVLERYIQFFGASIAAGIDARCGLPLPTIPPLSYRWLERTPEDAVDNIVTPMTELWNIAGNTNINQDNPSIGGYRIMRNGAVRVLTPTDPIPALIPANSNIGVTYIKNMRINAGANIGDLRYRVECERVLITAADGTLTSDELGEVRVIFNQQ